MSELREIFAIQQGLIKAVDRLDAIDARLVLLEEKGRPYEEKEQTYRVGQKFKIRGYRSEYMLVETSDAPNWLRAVRLDTYSISDMRAECKDLIQITDKEMLELTNGRAFEVIE